MNDTVTLDPAAHAALAEFRGSHEQATAALAQKAAAYNAAALGPQPAAPSAVARLMLDRLSRDADFQGKLSAGDQEANRQFAALCSAIATGDATADAMANAPEPSGDIIETTEGGQLSQSALRREVGALRGMGFGDAVIRQMISGSRVSAVEHQMATQMRAMRLSDADYVKRYLGGDAACRIEQSLLATIIAADVAA